MIYYFFATPGTWREVLRKGTTPIVVPRGTSAKVRELKDIKHDDVEKQLLEKNEELQDDSDKVEAGSSKSAETASLTQEEVQQREMDEADTSSQVAA